MSRGLGRERGVDGRARTRRWRIDDGATAAAAEKDPTMTGAARTSPERQLRRFPRAYRLRDIAADRVEERLRLLAPGRGRHGAHGCGPRGGTRRLDELRHRRVFRLTVGGFGNFSAPPKASAVAPTRTHRSTARAEDAEDAAEERSKMSCKCCGKPADPEDRRAKEMYAGPAFHLAPPPKPPAPRRLEHSWQHEWDASDRPPLYEAPKPNAFRPPPPAPRIPPAAAARMAGLDSPTVRAPTRDDDAREGDRADDGAAGATSPAGTADSAEAVRAALGLSPRSPGGRAGRRREPVEPGSLRRRRHGEERARVGVTSVCVMRRRTQETPQMARVAGARSGEGAAGETDRGPDGVAGVEHAQETEEPGVPGRLRRERRELGWRRARESQSQQRIRKPLQIQAFELSARVDVASVSARATAFGPAMSPAVAEARAADYPEAGSWGIRAEVARPNAAHPGGFRIGRRIVRRSLIRRMGFRGCRWAVVVTDGRCTSRGRRRGRAG